MGSAGLRWHKVGTGNAVIANITGGGIVRLKLCHRSLNETGVFAESSTAGILR